MRTDPLGADQQRPSPNYPHDWCWGCCQIENEPPQGWFRVCFECWHGYINAQEVIKAHNDLIQSFLDAPWCTDEDRAALRFETELEAIHSCPVCTHDW